MCHLQRIVIRYVSPRRCRRAVVIIAIATIVVFFNLTQNSASDSN